MNKKFKIIIGAAASAAAIAGITTSVVVATRKGEAVIIEEKSKAIDGTSKITEDKKLDPEQFIDSTLNEKTDDSQSTALVDEIQDKKVPELAFNLENKANNSNVDEKLITGQVKYVAFGDSISAGFNAKLTEDYQGELKIENDVKTIDGLSYPAFIAQYINRIDSTKLAAFKNFGVTSSTINDWNMLFDDSAEQSIIKREWQANYDTMKSDFLKRLTEANLLTISLGGNDFMAVVFDEIFKLDFGKLFGSGSLDMKAILGTVIPILTKIRKEIRERYTKLISNIRKHNKNVKINLISYPMPLLRFLDAINELTNGIEIEAGKQLSQYLLGIMNETIKNQATLDENVTYINSYDIDDWSKNVALFTKQLFDIHPTELGYKKMAQDILLKLSVDAKQYNSPSAINSSWDDDYIKTDKDFNNYLIKFDKSDNAIITGILGADRKDLFSNNDPLINKYKDKFDPYTFPDRYLNSERFSDMFNLIIHGILSHDFFKKLDPDAKLLAFLNEHGGENNSEIIKVLYDTKFIQNIWNIIQKKSDDILLSGEKLTVNTLVNVVTSSVLDLDNFHSMVKSITTSKFMQDVAKTNQLSKILQEIVTNLFKEKELFETAVGLIAKILPTSKIAGASVELIKSITATNILPDFLNELIEDAFVNIKEYAKTNSFSEYFALYLEKNKKTFATFINSLLETLYTKSPDSLNVILGVVLDSQLKEFKITLSDEETKLVGKTFTEVLKATTNSDIVNLMIDHLINVLKTSSVSKVDELFSKFQSSVFNEKTLMEIFFKLIQSKYFEDKDNLDKFSTTFKTLLKSLVKNTTVKQMVVNLFNKKEINSLEVDASAFQNALDEIINSTNTSLFIDGLVGGVFNNLDVLKKAENANEFTKQLLKHQKLNVVTYLKYVVGRFAEYKNTFTPLIINNLQSLIASLKISFTEGEVKNLVEIVSVSIDAIAKGDFIEDTYLRVLNSLETSEFSFNGLINAAMDKDNFFFGPLKSLIHSPTFKTQTVSQNFIKNLSEFLNSALKNPTIVNAVLGFFNLDLKDDSKAKIFQAWSKFFSNEKVKTLVDQLITSLFVDNEWVIKATNIKDFILGFLTKNEKEFVASIKSILNDLTENNGETFREILQVGLGLFNNSFSLNLQEKDIKDLEDVLFETIVIVSKSELPEVLLKEIKNAIGQDKIESNNLFGSLINVFLSDNQILWSVIKNFLSSTHLQTNSTAIGYSAKLKTAFEILLKNTKIHQFLGSFISDFAIKNIGIKAEASKYEQLIKFITTHPSTIQLLEDMFSDLFTNINIYKEFSSLQQFAAQFLKTNSGKIQKYLVDLVKELTTSDGILTNFVYSVAVEILQEKNVVLTSEGAKAVKKLVSLSAGVINESTIFDQTFKNLGHALESNVEISPKLIGILVNQILDADNLYFNLAKTISTSKTFENEATKGEFKDTLKSLFKELAISPKIISILLVKLGMAEENSRVLSLIEKDFPTFLSSQEFSDFFDLMFSLFDNGRSLFETSNNWDDLIIKVIDKLDVSQLNPIVDLIQSIFVKNPNVVLILLGLSVDFITPQFNISLSNSEELLMVKMLKETFGVLIDKTIITKLVTELKLAREKGASTTVGLLTNVLFNEDSLFNLLKVILNGKYLEEADNLSEFKNSLISVGTIVKNNDSVKKFFANFLLKQFGLDKDKKIVNAFAGATNALLSSDETVKMFTQFINSIFEEENFATYKNANSLAEIFKIFLSKNTLLITNYFDYVVTNFVLKSEEFKLAMASPLVYFAKQFGISISNDDLNLLATLIGESARVIKDANLINEILSKATELLSAEDAKVSNLFNDLIAVYTSQSDNLFNLLKKVVSSKAFEDKEANLRLKNSLKQVIFSLIQKDNVIPTLLSYFKFGNEKLDSQLPALAKQLVSDENFPELLDLLLEGFLVNPEWMKNANNFLEATLHFVRANGKAMLPIFSKFVDSFVVKNQESVVQLLNFAIDQFVKELSDELSQETKNKLSKVVLTALISIAKTEAPSLMIDALDKIDREGKVLSFDNIFNEILSDSVQLHKLIQFILNSELLTNESSSKQFAEDLNVVVDALFKTKFFAKTANDIVVSMFVNKGPKYDSTSIQFALITNQVLSNVETQKFAKSLINFWFLNRNNLAITSNLDQMLVLFLNENKAQFSSLIKSNISLLKNKPEFNFVVKTIVKSMAEKVGFPLNDDDIEVLMPILENVMDLTVNSEILELLVNRFADGAQKAITKDGSHAIFFGKNSILESLIMGAIDADNMFWAPIKLVTKSKFWKEANNAKDLTNNVYNFVYKILDNKQFIQKLLVTVMPEFDDVAGPVSNWLNKLKQNHGVKEFYDSLMNGFIQITKNNSIDKYSSMDALILDIVKVNRPTLEITTVKLVNNILGKIDDDFMEMLHKFAKPQLHNMGIMIRDEDKAKYLPFIKTLLKSLQDTEVISQIVKGAFNAFVKLKSFNGFATPVVQSALASVLEIINNGDYLSISKVVEKKGYILNLFKNKEDGKNFADFFNLLFDRSDVSDTTGGMYRIIQNMIHPGSIPASTDSTDSASLSSSSINLKVDLWDVFTNLQPLIDTLFTVVDTISYSIAQQQVDYLINNKWTSYVENEYFKANYRLIALMLWVMYHQTPSPFFWTGLSGTIEVSRYIYQASNRAYWRAITERWNEVQSLPGVADIYYKENRMADRIFGSRFEWIRRSNFGRSDLLAYIYYEKQGDSIATDPHRKGWPITKTILSFLEAGYSK